MGGCCVGAPEAVEHVGGDPPREGDAGVGAHVGEGRQHRPAAGGCVVAALAAHDDELQRARRGRAQALLDGAEQHGVEAAAQPAVGGHAPPAG